MKKLFTCIITVVIILNFSLCALAKDEKKDSLPVDIKAKAAVLMDCNSGKVLLSVNEHEKLPPASVTKIMPMLLIVEAIDEGKISLSDTVTTSADAAAKGGSQIWLKEGETMSVDDMLKSVAVGSANDACAALGEYLAGSEQEFVNMMNERAKELGMNDTIFYNCSGLDDEDTNITSAYDIALMSCELMKHDLIQKYTTIWMDNVRDGKTELVNTNKLVRFYPGTTGLKTGTTNKAGCCLSATALRKNLHLCAVVLGSDNSSDRFESAKAMLNWGFSNWVSVSPVIDKKLITPVKVLLGEKNEIMPDIPTVEALTVKKGEEKNLKQTISLVLDVSAPVEKGQTLGRVVFSLNNEEIGSYPLRSPEHVDKLSFAGAFRKLMSKIA